MPGAGARRVVFALLYALAAFTLVVVPMLPRETLERHAWAFVHLADLPVIGRLALLAVMLACAHAFRPPHARRVVAIAQRLTTAHPRATMAAIAAASFALFWIFRDTNFELGDSALLIRVLTRDVHARGYHIRFDEPLELYVHSVAYAWLHRLAGWDVARSYALVSAIGGVAAVGALTAYCARLTPRLEGRILAFALFVTSGFFALFFGHVENYTLVLLGLIVYLLVADMVLARRVPLFWAALTLSLSLCLHALAGFFLPSLAWLWLEIRTDGRGGLRDLAMAAIGLAIPVAATFVLCAALGVGPEQVGNTHAAALKFIPLLDRDYVNFQYSFLAPGHVAAVWNQLVLTALPGLLAILVALWQRFASGPGEPLLDARGRFLVAFAACGQFLALTWNPDLGAYRDWDLFAVVGLGYAALGAYLVARVPGAARAALPIVVACGFLNAAWIHHNARQQTPVVDHHDSLTHDGP